MMSPLLAPTQCLEEVPFSQPDRRHVSCLQWLNSSLFSTWLTIAGRIYHTAWIRLYFISFLVLG